MKCGALYDTDDFPNDNKCRHLKYEFNHIDEDYISYYCTQCHKYWEVVTDKDTGKELVVEQGYEPTITVRQFKERAAALLYEWGIKHSMNVPNSVDELVNSIYDPDSSRYGYYIEEIIYVTDKTDLKFACGDHAHVTIIYDFETNEFRFHTTELKGD